ncbi:hypothetical protein SAMN05216419_10145 [Nitrosomonas cryotolerans]|uniref:Uncharacterized protein n=1 Tax=Nitrosomonas cryotolerans ATCC 49181 TaxID=1131553 RepID=A0A1N6F3D6_9PROT|nr:hypothetical protein [Nitrosomonas cryotolerans]SFP70300.1 hypothetical protein SAMN05216419_10145 [Nitrosomonas cryotolerans]SIN89716.1 hypothetical protein SAMN02743940_0066 [Nitrosomonas cryotolerans ATCC 49181]
MISRFMMVSAALVLSGCMLTSPALPVVTKNGALDRCWELYQDLDQTVADHGVTPSRPERITGFPYLRMTRFLASYSQQDLSNEALQSWLKRLMDADQAARSVELASLEKSEKGWLSTRYGTDLTRLLEDCAHRLVAIGLARPERLALLREQAVAASEYRLLNQVFGLYPLLSLPVRFGVNRYQKRVHAVFAQSLEMLPVQGQIRRFQMPPRDVYDASDGMAYDALGIPLPTTRQLEALFAMHAPVWEIDVVDNYDLPGRPVWQTNNQPSVDYSTGLVYYYPSYTRWQGQALLQLNYLIWFSERPSTNIVDIFSGALDGLLWRVTLDTAGNVMIYDSIHACGCYHYFFPTASLVLRAEAAELPEPPLLPQSAPSLTIGQRLIIRIASGSHYIQKLYADMPSGRTLHGRSYQELYFTPTRNKGHRSLFRPDGLIEGSARLERWLLWPMGVPSAGAMRERGHHATAFIGRRHFDDAALLESLFKPVSGPVY